MLNNDPDAWKPYEESLFATLLRTVVIGLVVGALLARWMGGFSYWPIATVLALWFSFGGHWVELLFLNVLRPRLPRARAEQGAARLVVWFVGGTILAMGMKWTAVLAGLQVAQPRAWWLGGIGFVCIELVVHVALLLRGRPNFYNGRG